MSKSFAYFNPALKFLTLILMVVLPFIFPTLLGEILTSCIIFRIFSILYSEHDVKNQLKRNFIICLLVFGCIGAISSYILKLPEVIYYTYNITYIYYGVFVSLYVGNCYVYGKMVMQTTTLFEFWSSMHQNLHLSKFVAYSCYRSMLFITNFKAEYDLVNRMLMTRGIYTGKFSFRILEVVVNNLKRKISENDVVMESKGFDHHTPKGNYKTYTIDVYDFIIPTGIILCFIGSFILVKRGWLL
ncbi:MAG: hypothetical protein IKM20_08145 [Erysipelotrichales bacterium]|nr:hypothetical protein [Erysipelotrichales bacterium]